MNYYYYPKTLWTITNAFLDIWNDIEVRRYDTNDTVVETISAVPIRYGHVTKAQQDRRREEQGLDYWYQQIPRIGVTMTSLAYDPSRARSPNDGRFWLDEEVDLNSSLTLKKDFNPTPYNYSFQTTVLTNSMEDMSIILENVLPYFNPVLNLEVYEFSFLNVRRSLITTLDGVSLDFTDELGEEERRILRAQIDCTVQGWMYKPVADASIVKTINSKYFANSVYVNEFETIGFKGTSAIESVSAYDVSGISLSASNPNDSIYFVNNNITSANI
jgi:hypothetical protein